MERKNKLDCISQKKCKYNSHQIQRNEAQPNRTKQNKSFATVDYTTQKAIVQGSTS